MGLLLLDIEQQQAMGRTDPLDRDQREIGIMLVVELVELVALERALEMRELERRHALAASAAARCRRRSR